VRTADVVELDAVVVDVVEDGQAGLLTSTVRLRLTLDSSVGPGKAAWRQFHKTFFFFVSDEEDN
jgi:hypothetical protein